VAIVKNCPATEKRLVLADVGVHVLDVTRFLLGEAERVYCETQSVRPNIAGEDMATVLLRHISGAISVVECSYASALPEENFPQTLIVVEGSSGSVRLGPNYQIAVRSRDGLRQFGALPASPPWGVPPWHVVQDSVRRTQEHWIECIHAGIEPQTSGRDNLKTLALVEAAYCPAASGTQFGRKLRRLIIFLLDKIRTIANHMKINRRKFILSTLMTAGLQVCLYSSELRTRQRPSAQSRS
jgi:predicted dehydrogenase